MYPIDSIFLNPRGHCYEQRKQLGRVPYHFWLAPHFLDMPHIRSRAKITCAVKPGYPVEMNPDFRLSRCKAASDFGLQTSACRSFGSLLVNS